MMGRINGGAGGRGGWIEFNYNDLRTKKQGTGGAIKQAVTECLAPVQEFILVFLFLFSQDTHSIPTYLA